MNLSQVMLVITQLSEGTSSQSEKKDSKTKGYPFRRSLSVPPYNYPSHIHDPI